MDHPSPTLPDNAERAMTLVGPREPGARLRVSEEVKILELSAAGKTQQQIAGETGCSQSSVSRVLAEYQDSRPLARKFLEAAALPLSKRFVDDALPRDTLRMLQKLDVIRDDDETTRIGVSVVIGSEAHPAIQADAVAVEVIEGTARNDDADR